VFIESWNNFFIPLMTTNTPNISTVSLVLQSYTGGYGVLYNDSFAAAAVASVVPLIIFVLLGRYFVRGLMAMGNGAKGIIFNGELIWYQ
jgi:ABC-type sugar transport system, permease component